MKKFFPCKILTWISLVIAITFANKGLAQTRWTGTLKLTETVTSISGPSSREVNVSFVNALPTLYRDVQTTDLNFTDDKGQGSSTYHAEGIINGKKFSTTDCHGVGLSELHSVVINEEEGNYDIEAIGPGCTGTTVSSADGSIEPYGPEVSEIMVSAQPLIAGANRDVLSGSKTETIVLPGDLGQVTRTIIWSLRKANPNNAELIVIPEDYDKWLPEPGEDEFTQGTVMKVSLKLRGKNGQLLNQKAKGFEIRLSNTSHEPGITLNYPLEPSSPSLPDIRFLPQTDAAIEDDFQVMKISCNNCITADLKMAAYDGGGFTTVIATAILEDDSRITGNLLVGGGISEIPIPRRKGSMIGEFWLMSHGNPGDYDDVETSIGNNHNGDGLTAYEEYRGVISGGKFKRLDPKKKEIGIQVIKSQIPLFKDGLGLLKNGSGIDTVIFYEDEIGVSGRLNKNYSQGHNYDQCVLILKKSRLPKFVGGKAYTPNDEPALPNQTLEVNVDVDQIQGFIYSYLLKIFGSPLPYSPSELIAATVAHELAHGMKVFHHGDTADRTPEVIYNSTAFQIFDRAGQLVTLRPFSIEGPIGEAGSEGSGDYNCIMIYNPYYKWSFRKSSNGIGIYRQVPAKPIGHNICKSKAGTVINTPNDYFGDAITKGNCLSQFQLR